MLPRPARRDWFILACLAGVWIALFATCPRIASYRATVGDDGRPFQGHVVAKKFVFPAYRAAHSAYPIKFSLVTDCTDGMRRQILVPFATYAHTPVGEPVTRDGQSVLRVSGVVTPSTR